MPHEPETEHEDHPRGALTLALLFGVVTVLVWLSIYFGVFVPRG
jgi:hypothetical protein